MCSDDVIVELTEKISDLEAKLAESEEKKESYRLQNDEHHLQLLQFYSRLGVEAFGADIHEKALETLMTMKEKLVEFEKVIEKYDCKSVKRLNGRLYRYDQYETKIFNMEEEIKGLKQQLAESEEEIKVIDEDRQFKAEMWTRFADKCKDLEQQLADTEAQNKRVLEKLDLIVRRNQELENELVGRKKLCDLIYEQLKQTHQDKVSFAVEMLEKVKKCLYKIQSPIGEKPTLMDDGDVFEVINNQIKAIKEME